MDKTYENFGAEGLKVKQNKVTYSVQFKLDVLSFMKRTGSSETETALHFGLQNSTIITSWKVALLNGKLEGLKRPKGGRRCLIKRTKKIKILMKKVI